MDRDGSLFETENHQVELMDAGGSHLIFTLKMPGNPHENLMSYVEAKPYGRFHTFLLRRFTECQKVNVTARYPNILLSHHRWANLVQNSRWVGPGRGYIDESNRWQSYANNANCDLAFNWWTILQDSHGFPSISGAWSPGSCNDYATSNDGLWFSLWTGELPNGGFWKFFQNDPMWFITTFKPFPIDHGYSLTS